jgi:hypothetical protein
VKGRAGLSPVLPGMDGGDIFISVPTN